MNKPRLDLGIHQHPAFGLLSTEARMCFPRETFGGIVNWVRNDNGGHSDLRAEMKLWLRLCGFSSKTRVPKSCPDFCHQFVCHLKVEDLAGQIIQQLSQHAGEVQRQDSLFLVGTNEWGDEVTLSAFKSAIVRQLFKVRRKLPSIHVGHLVENLYGMTAWKLDAETIESFARPILRSFLENGVIFLEEMPDFDEISEVRYFEESGVIRLAW